jgi:hypothetical protein
MFTDTTTTSVRMLNKVPYLLISFQSVTELQRKNVGTFCEMGGKREAQIVNRNYMYVFYYLLHISALVTSNHQAFKNCLK